MTESEWLQSTGPAVMLEFLRGKASNRKLRLFAVACCRIWHQWDGYQGERRAVEAAERFADGLAAEKELRAAGNDAEPIPMGGAGLGGAGHNVTRTDAWDAAAVVSRLVAEAVGLASPGGDELERQAQADLLRDIVGDPLEPATADAAYLERDDGLVVRLANAAYEERLVPSGHLDTRRLAVLADALLDAGCPPDSRIVRHLRSPGPHPRGCLAVDCILGKE